MRLFLPLLLLIFLGSAAFCSDRTDSLITVLKAELARADRYDNPKAFRLQKMKAALARTPKFNYPVLYVACNLIYEEYKSYKFDSAYVYTQKMLAISRAANDVPRQNESRIKLAFILISAGMFKETFDCLHEINTQALTPEAKQEYYSIKSRAYGDLADYNSGNDYAKADEAIASRYLDSAIAFSKPNSFERLINQGGRQVQRQELQQPSIYYSDLLSHYPLTAHQRAMVATGLSRFYYRPQDKEERIALLTIAAINDIRSSTKETLAIFRLGEELYQQGNVMDAYTFIQQAMNNAQFYGARLRTIKIGAVLPVIAAKRLIITENEKKRFLIYLVSITALAIVISLISFIVFNQLKRLRIKEKIIEDKNLQLEQINNRLVEDTRIKEEYIGNFFNIISEYISKLEKLKRSIERKLTTKKYDEILSTINEINIKKEREQLFYTFDHTFLKIFPNFIPVFNSLLKKEDQIWPKDHEVLNTDLRIFALIRLGIDNNQTIANILEYSVNTIYVYKMRVKAKAIVSSEQFDHAIMSIKAVD
jgi:hypothetical protein